MTILVDTSALFALGNADDRHNAEVSALVNNATEPLVVPITVLPEACYLYRTRLGYHAEIALITSLASGELLLEQVALADVQRAVELMGDYADARLGFVDSSVVAIAERLNIRRIATLDRRDFSIVRPRHCPAFTLLP